MTWPAEMIEREREMVEERAAIVSEGCHVSQEEAERRVVEMWRAAKEKRKPAA